MSAAVVTGTLATLPLSSLTESPRYAGPEDIAAVDQLLAPEQRPAPPASDVPRPLTAAEPAAPPSDASDPMADANGVPLVVPSSEAVLVGFHESLNPGAIPLAPEDGATDSMVLPTRNRPAPSTSAIDIAIPEGESVLAPLDGQVVAVSPYFLYGQHPDVRIDVVPADRPDLRVIIIHVADVEVAVGDTLVGGETVVAGTATPFPFESQVDRFTSELHGEPTPHVHIEVTRVA